LGQMTKARFRRAEVAQCLNLQARQNADVVVAMR
jgi:hypothetical protein